ncbi:SGNH/GDSL hydrolase family protein [Amycolatopsis sp. H20-H5]|uniref:SGNH/GDSL hydrolase family protein n=1 Tax=Amycolatopsis sp. H20-H5 TaxID=3046309 RepID=UPI002DBBF290|nr:SGNH/GDSL hydrolase family protein [Amycolatopsis sp. H20-H5]MEC3981088.1 SGNH/GDSL hydrolase family protein [Amycolatopsis sp. H20-H5]
MLAVPGVASATPAHYSHYVALGDSYTAGPLIPFQRLDPLTCFRSTSNYPAWLASNLGIDDYTDVSCSSADTTNMTKPQSIPLWQAAPQFTALKSDTDLVTIGIGGNDSSVFGTLVGDCPKFTAKDPTGSPCRDSFTVGGVDTMKRRLVTTQASVTEMLRGVHQRSPHAKVLLIGYPRIVPATGYCPDVLPFADGDIRWVDSVEQALNKALADAAKADGKTTYVDTFTPSLGHDACATGGAAWIQGKDLNLFAAFPYHPNKSGMMGVASIIQHQLNGKKALVKTPSTAGVPLADPQVAGELAATAGVLKR